MAVPAEFPAHAFHDSLPGGRVSGLLRVHGHALVFTSADQSVTLPLPGLSLSLGGASNRLVFCTHAAAPGWQIYTADKSLLKVPELVGHEALAQVQSQRWKHHGHFWGLLTASVVALVLLGLGLWWSLDAMSATAARRVPVAWEEKLGDTVMQQYQLGKDFMPEREAKPLLAPLTSPLTAALAKSPRPYTLRFHLVNDPAINAFALPGGYVVINSGLILNAKSAAEVQGVLGHEIAHVTQQHGLRAVIRSTGIYVIAQTLIGDASGLVAIAANAAPLLINQKYSRDFEREADAKGFDLLVAAKINPRGMVEFFRTIQAEQDKQLKKITDEKTRDAMATAQGLLGSHPETEERIRNLQARAEKTASSGWRDDEAAFLALQEKVKAFVSDSEAAAAAGETTGATAQ